MDAITPRVSVIMATYNGASWVAEQVRSILDQLGPLDELCIFDDCSTDETLRRLSSFSDSRLRIVQNAERKGPWRNFTDALATAQGSFVLPADQDDLWLPGKIEHLVSLLELGYELVMHDATVIDSSEKPLFDSYSAERGVRHGVVHNVIKNSYTGCFMGCTQEFLRAVQPFPQTIPYDQWLGLCAEWRQSSYFSPEKFVLWRRHGATVTHPFVEKHFSWWGKGVHLFSNGSIMLRTACYFVRRMLFCPLKKKALLQKNRSILG